MGATWDHALAFSYAGELDEVRFSSISLTSVPPLIAHLITLRAPIFLGVQDVYPAKDNDGVCNDTSKCVPAGGRFQLDPSYPCSTTTALSLEWQRQMCRTLQVYGMIIIDKPCVWPCMGGGVHSENPFSVRLPLGGGAIFPQSTQNRPEIMWIITVGLFNLFTFTSAPVAAGRRRRWRWELPVSL